MDPLTSQQIATYIRDGILVVDNLLSADELKEAHEGLAQTLMENYGVDVHDLENTGHKLVEASSTNGAGGVLDIFYPDWKMKIATNEVLFRMTCQLWKEAYCHSGETLEDLSNSTIGEADGNVEAGSRSDDLIFKWHPFGAFDCDKGYMYIDRIGYRIPTKLAERIGKELINKDAMESTSTLLDTESKSSNNATTKAIPKKKKRPKKARPIQRSLTPHFDCCPENYHDTTNKNKWRPIQCFVSLTDNPQPNTGGFEAVPGFHREFQSWVRNGRRQLNNNTLMRENEEEVVSTSQQSQSSSSSHPQPCVGEYTHLSPSHDRDIMQRIEHIPVRAGTVVFWDNRIPHGNAYRNDNTNGGSGRSDNGDSLPSTTSSPLGQSGSRAVVYCSFLPDVEVNKRFIQQQLADWEKCRAPRVGDRWIKQDEVGNEAKDNDGQESDMDGSNIMMQNLSDLGKKLLGVTEWE